MKFNLFTIILLCVSSTFAGGSDGGSSQTISTGYTCVNIDDNSLFLVVAERNSPDSLKNIYDGSYYSSSDEVYNVNVQIVDLYDSYDGTLLLKAVGVQDESLSIFLYSWDSVTDYLSGHPIEFMGTKIKIKCSM